MTGPYVVTVRRPSHVNLTGSEPYRYEVVSRRAAATTEDVAQMLADGFGLLWPIDTGTARLSDGTVVEVEPSNRLLLARLAGVSLGDFSRPGGGGPSLDEVINAYNEAQEAKA